MARAKQNWFFFCLTSLLLGSAAERVATADDPPPGLADWSDWEQYRHTVVHPATVIKSEDLARAKENVARYGWAQAYVKQLVASADDYLPKLTDAYVEQMIETTTPGCTGPCPACRAKGLAWHPNGLWSWSPARPEQLECSACQTVFPNESFPETVEVNSSWGRGQKITFIGGETFVCFGYGQARPSLSSIIRARKVAHMTNIAATLALAHALTDDPRFARGVRLILLRLAAVFPEYLVRAGYGYGETAGMDPHVAARQINNLPEDELVYPPNKPDRKIYTGYWSATRIGTSGMDGGWVVPIALAYDLTCSAQADGAPIYSDDERKRVERDLLLESVYLALCDPAINNKSVGNRAGAAVVGMCVGHPGLVHFGLEGFRRCVDEWFLPDGGTSESPAYAMMTMNGIAPFALALRDYSDPQGYAPPDGQRLESFNACRDTRYGDCWQALIRTLQGDLHFPPSADSYRSTRISGTFAELLAAAYPTEQHLALLKETVEADPSRDRSRDSLLLRAPGLEERETASVELPDVVFPFLAQGYLRTGDHGRESLALLNASDYGGHHHLDSLDLYYWIGGHELLSDLGYLWDHPDKHQTYRTLAHNLVMIDGRDQQTRGRGGHFHLFSVTPRMKVMEASSDAYGADTHYRRTCVLIDHGPSGSYVIDVFRARGGKRRDYVFHGPSKQFEISGLTRVPAGPPTGAGEDPNPVLPLESLQEAAGDQAWRIVWTLEDGYEFQALSPGQPGETCYVGEGWGQRDHRNSDRGSTLPYIVRRRTGENQTDAFVAIFAGNPAGKRLVNDVHLLPIERGNPSTDVAVAVTTELGVDVIISTLEPGSLRTAVNNGSEIATDGRVAGVLCDSSGKPLWACLLEGTQLTAGELRLSLPAAASRGDIAEAHNEPGESYFELRGEWPDYDTVGQTLFAIDEQSRRAYPIVAVERDAERIRVFTKRHGGGFDARPAQRYELPARAVLAMPAPND